MGFRTNGCSIYMNGQDVKIIFLHDENGTIELPPELVSLLQWDDDDLTFPPGTPVTIHSHRRRRINELCVLFLTERGDFIHRDEGVVILSQGMNVLLSLIQDLVTLLRDNNEILVTLSGQVQHTSETEWIFRLES